MNYHLAALVAVGSLVAAGTLRLIYRHVCGLSARTANDVYPFLLKIDMEAIYGTFHPDSEKHFRETSSKAEFKQLQFKRIHLAIHYCNQLSNNAQVLLSWIRHERKQDWIATSPPAIQNTVGISEFPVCSSRLLFSSSAYISAGGYSAWRFCHLLHRQALKTCWWPEAGK
jgi:hypothetical protein